MKTVVVAGAGISGLATAEQIRKIAAERELSLRCVVLEAEDRPGGKVRTVQEGGYTCESGPNGFLDNKPHTLALARAVGLGDELDYSSDRCRRRYVHTEGRLHLLPAGTVDFFLCSLLSWGAKLRMSFEPLLPRRPPTRGDESIAQFGRRRLGREAYEKLIDPMVSGVFGGNPEELSLLSCFPRIHELEQHYGSLVRAFLAISLGRLGDRHRETRGNKRSSPAGPGGVLTSFHGGLETLVRRLGERCGEELRCASPARAVRPREGGGFLVELDGDSIEADAVVSAVPAPEAADMLRSLDGELAAPLEAIPYAPMVVLCLGYPREACDHDLDGFGFLIPSKENRGILGALWTSSIFAGRAPDGSILFRVMLGGARHPEILAGGEEAWMAAARKELGELLGVRGEPSFRKVFAWERAIPQYVLGHGRRLDELTRVRQRHPGLFVTGNALRGVAVNDCTRNAETVGEAVVSYLATLVS